MAYLDDLNLPQFPSDAACEAAQINLPTLKNWISRKPPAVFVADDERVQVGERTSFRFTLRRVLQIAVVAELVRFRIGPSDAAWMAAEFTDSQKDFEDRRPGELFKKDFTVLVVSSSQLSSLVNASAQTSWRLLPKLSLNPSSSSNIIVNLNHIDMRVRVSLGLPIWAREGVI
ncbi:hypothetical protein [Bradyrhizobium sp. CW1]|uniref:hypothetical protein n=1 Tax=Bradyrhizobium sp. CW1 TaxID=2782686 RepID=UPI001FFF8327|nr:hypothetical protein [Bradyrhizobium sp. CW1]UPJ27086.1 hypothetical protein IVB54_36685 [Bradyrhizobium sp. CW1]